jgi:hypothetical protein
MSNERQQYLLAGMPITSADLYDGLYRIGFDDGEYVPTDIVAQLVAFNMAELGDDGRPRLTGYGETCFLVMEAGDGRVAEFG